MNRARRRDRCRRGARGKFRGTSQQGGLRFAHLKIAPGQKIPFSTLSFRMPDEALLAGLREGDTVEFVAERRGGDDGLLALRRPG